MYLYVQSTRNYNFYFYFFRWINKKFGWMLKIHSHWNKIKGCFILSNKLFCSRKKECAFKINIKHKTKWKVEGERRRMHNMDLIKKKGSFLMNNNNGKLSNTQNNSYYVTIYFQIHHNIIKLKIPKSFSFPSDKTLITFIIQSTYRKKCLGIFVFFIYQIREVWTFFL